MSLTAALNQSVNRTFASLGKLARPATYESHTGNIARDIPEGEAIAEVVTYKLKRVVFTNFEEREIDNSAVRATDQKVLFPSSDLPAEPKVGDTIIDCRGSKWRILKRFDSPGSLIVKAQVREAHIETASTVQLKKYWGVSTQETLDGAGIRALGNNAIATELETAVRYNATGGRYLYFAYPATLGLLSAVTVGGLHFTDYSTTPIQFTESGHPEPYNLIRIRNIQTGNPIFVVWA